MTARDTSQVQPHEQIVGYLNVDGSHEGDWVARTEYVRPEATESVADFLLALGVMGLLVLAGLAWFAVASASQAVR
jgi:hypothetical protein